MKPILFLLKSDFVDVQLDRSQKFYCPHCAMIDGILHYYPHLKDCLDIRHVDFPRPRNEIIKLVGEENQDCPLLIISNESYNSPLVDSFPVFKDFRFTNDKMKMATFFANQFKAGLWHP
jgi:hypothetical protein